MNLHARDLPPTIAALTQLTQLALGKWPSETCCWVQRSTVVDGEECDWLITGTSTGGSEDADEGDSCLCLIRVQGKKDELKGPSMTLTSRLHPVDIKDNDIDRVRAMNGRIVLKSNGGASGGLIAVAALDDLYKDVGSQTAAAAQLPSLCTFLPSANSSWVPGGLGLDLYRGNKALIASSCKDGRVSIHNISSGTTKVITAHRTPGKDTNDAKFSLESMEVLASVGEDGSISLLDTRAFTRPSLSFQGHHSAVNSICFSPDQPLIATAGADNAVKVWDVRALSSNKGNIIRSLFDWKSHRCPVIQVEWCPHRPHRLISADAMGLIFHWSTAPSDQLRGSKDIEANLLPKNPWLQSIMGGHARAVNDFACNEENGTVASVSSASVSSSSVRGEVIIQRNMWIVHRSN